MSGALHHCKALTETDGRFARLHPYVEEMPSAMPLLATRILNRCDSSRPATPAAHVHYTGLLMRDMRHCGMGHQALSQGASGHVAWDMRL